MSPPNLFAALSHYGSSHGENYLTEAFVHVLRILQGREPEGFLDVVGLVCGLPENRRHQSAEKVELSTQSSIIGGRPDIQFRFAGNDVVFVEVKDWSPLGDGQLRRYYESINEMYGEAGRLVLLTRSKNSRQETTLSPSLYHHVCWYEIYSCLSELVVDDELAAHYVTEFMGFLEGKAMGVQKVSWEFENGVKSMLVLTNILETAVSEVFPDWNVKRTAGWSWRGLYLDGDYFLGFRFDEPMLLVFENNQGTNPTYAAKMDLHEAHFHSLSAGEQLEAVADFIRSAGTEAGEAETHEQQS